MKGRLANEDIQTQISHNMNTAGITFDVLRFDTFANPIPRIMKYHIVKRSIWESSLDMGSLSEF
jgi:hypothetical protein